MSGAGLATTSGALYLLHQLASAPHPAVEVLVLTAANLLVTLMRFVAMRVWIFRAPEPLDGEGKPGPLDLVQGAKVPLGDLRALGKRRTYSSSPARMSVVIQVVTRADPMILPRRCTARCCPSARPCQRGAEGVLAHHRVDPRNPVAAHRTAVAHTVDQAGAVDLALPTANAGG